MRFLAVIAFLLFSSGTWAWAAPAPEAAALSLFWGLPFLFILLAMAFSSLLFPEVWERHFRKIVLAGVLIFLIPYSITFGPAVTLTEITETLLEEFIPFILLLTALFVISGGIFVDGYIAGTPKNNIKMLGLGTLLASIMGTTGAALLLVRPLLRANKNRRHRAHPLIFLIFLVANIGGGLTPVGDPPLFLGFLHGVDFFWTARHLGLPVLFNVVLLLGLFFLIDVLLYQKEDPHLKTQAEAAEKRKIKIEGKRNIVLLLLVSAVIILSGVFKSQGFVDILGTHVLYSDLSRDGMLILLTLISWFATPQVARHNNEFNWAPIKEVAVLFSGLFITIIPVLMMLRAGENGAFAGLIAFIHDAKGEPIPELYFWFSGILSAFLDNAPTYLVFFNLASGDAEVLMGPLALVLTAISMGSVFMGALTYIGNAPNLMVKAIAERQGLTMPGFFGYMGWSLVILLPLYWLDTWLFL